MLAPPVRGCGVRQPGGAYLVTDLSDSGLPLEHFVLDPPRPLDPVAAGLSAQGMALAQDAQGNRDGAIQGYRQVAESAAAPREVAVAI